METLRPKEIIGEDRNCRVFCCRMSLSK